MLKVWITGAEGHIGTALQDLLDIMDYQLLTTDIHEVNITNLNEVSRYAHRHRPDVIINCASLTDVDYCEKHVDEAYRVNAIGVRNLALAADEVHAKIIHMSTDDVFDLQSETPYNEFDAVHPKTVYGKSKEAGERMLMQMNNRFVIIRSSWLYGIGRDFVHYVLDSVGKVDRLEVPNNSFASPTSSYELAKVIRYFIDNDEYGLFHAVCKGGCSRYDFAKAILKYAGKEDQLEIYPVISQNETRPQYSMLDNMMLRLTNIPEPKSWETALKEYLESEGK